MGILEDGLLVICTTFAVEIMDKRMSLKHGFNVREGEERVIESTTRKLQSFSEEDECCCRSEMLNDENALVFLNFRESRRLIVVQGPAASKCPLC